MSKLRVEFDIAYGAQKLLVPTIPEYNRNDPTVIASGYPSTVSVPISWVQSFYDASGTVNYDSFGNTNVESGSILQEEINEITHQRYLEARVVIFDHFSFRLSEGLSILHATKGQRQLLTLVTGISVHGFAVDYMRWIPIASNSLYRSTHSVALSYRWNIGLEDRFKHPVRVKA
jgi:hypothetical protein